MATAEITAIPRTIIALPVEHCRALFGAVSFAAESDNSRYVLAAVQLVIEPFRLTVRATDGRHMALRTIETAIAYDHATYLIPRAVAERIGSIGSTGRGDVVITIEGYDTVARWNQRGGFREVRDETPIGRFPDCELVAAQVARDVPTCTMRGTVELVLENLPSVELLDGWSLDPVGRQWTKAPVPFQKPVNKKQPQVELEGSAAPPIDTDRFRAWLRTLSEKQSLEFRWADGPCSGWVDGELRYVLMPLRGKS